MKKRVVFIVEVDLMFNNVVIYNFWIDFKRNRKIIFEDSEIREKCLVF